MKIKKSGMIAACVAAVLILWVAVIIYGNPFKVTDPSDPRFNPDKFSFADYRPHEKLIEAFNVLFPVGTPKEFVDRVLVRAGGAKQAVCSDYEYGKTCSYEYPFLRQPMIKFKATDYRIIFDQKGNLVGKENNKNFIEVWNSLGRKLSEGKKQ